ncbi:tRNA-dihydrouridine synthase family protein [Accumulibacter sp.]|uniref:tRNA dihydrouridine synthase n=1 Tax=Accumulibacter sp. TaxID=2053492 RepID=UPI0025F0E593|nr:tRNA-dihydrouridine synthase family protein [Accumulibacter sp.]MCM8612977.1 tRNA-dihydrouridine synthase family protein [Accumulibacter sp.]MCM8636964.1 tRNA-dihydrouridine synthase family protein [Accumulibacter sp.]MCM8639284.1 tRNA-dihydrouridine synthase family protein [Accumulibacter sp.]
MGRLLLAPMEGLLDDVLRDVLTRVGGYDLAVSEFIRVAGTLLPQRNFVRVCPELARAGRTRAGTPLVVQLLGSDPACLADNAGQLSRLAPAGIDLNFGCPAPRVNRHGGGATLLADPEQLFRIASSVRRAVPTGMPFSAKMRLGVRDTSRTLECARALADGGVDSLVVHARTRAEGYRPPAHWEWVARIREVVAQPVAANGEVWTMADYRRCRAVSGCRDVMLGRGAVADPFLARNIRRVMAGEDGDGEVDRGADWQELLPLLASYWQQVCAKVAPQHAPGRLKLWLAALRPNFSGAAALFLAIRPLRTVDEVNQRLWRHGVLAAAGDGRQPPDAG